MYINIDIGIVPNEDRNNLKKKFGKKDIGQKIFLKNDGGFKLSFQAQIRMVSSMLMTNVGDKMYW